MRSSRIAFLFAIFSVSACGSSSAPAASTDVTDAESGADATADASVEAAAEASVPYDGPANVVFVLADDFAWNLVQYMPNLQQMQKDGVTFENYFVTDSLCCPSRSSIFTGLFPHDTGVFTNSGSDGGYATFKSKGNEAKTFAVTLKAGGYKTAFMGKYLNGYTPETDGVPQGWLDWAVAGNGYPEFNYSLNQNGTVVSYGAKPKDYLTDVVAGLGAKFIEASAAGPLMIEIATFAPHAPYTPAPRHEMLFPDLKAPRTAAYGARPTMDDPKWLQSVPALTPTEETNLDTAFRKRAQAIQAIDEMIGNLRKQLVALGIDKKTYVVFSSDNGYHMGEHSMRAGKQTAFDTDIRVPLIVVGPGVPAGRTAQEIVENIDLCPTFAELGKTTIATAAGRSLVPLFHGESVADWRDVALIEHHGADFTDPTDPDVQDGTAGDPPSYEAARTATSVYVEYSDGEKEFHDHATDPFELKNTVAGLSTEKAAAWHATVQAMVNCHDAASCRAAQHLAK